MLYQLSCCPEALFLFTLLGKTTENNCLSQFTVWCCCTIPPFTTGMSWSQKRWRRMSFGETTSTEWGLPSRALNWLLWHQSPPLPLPNPPTATHRPAGKLFQNTHFLFATGPWMKLRMEAATKRMNSFQNSKRCWSYPLKWPFSWLPPFSAFVNSY